MERGFKYRIYPNESQRDKIARMFGCCRFVYNRALDVKKTAYSETGKNIATNDLIKMIPTWKRDPETSWLAQADSMALQQSIRDLDRAYKNFFRRVRKGQKPGFPKFKSRRHTRQSYRTNGGKVIDRNHIALPKLGTVRAKYLDRFKDVFCQSLSPWTQPAAISPPFSVPTCQPRTHPQPAEKLESTSASRRLRLSPTARKSRICAISRNTSASSRGNRGGYNRLNAQGEDVRP